jgi:hypothetical protein
MPEARRSLRIAAIDAPPPRVVGAARSAFRDANLDAARVHPVHDSWNDLRTTRSLAFRCPGLALVLTLRVVPGGLSVEGRSTGSSSALTVVLRRPGRPDLRLAATGDCRIGPTTVPHGIASIETEYHHRGTSTRWQSDWLKL